MDLICHACLTHVYTGNPFLLELLTDHAVETLCRLKHVKIQLEYQFPYNSACIQFKSACILRSYTHELSQIH